MENTSGQGKAAVVPEEVKGLAWGAFFWSWIWGLFNRTWIALLILIPIVGLVMWVMLLFKGREWAWRNKRWDSVEHFNKVQRRWAKAGLIILCVPFLLGIIAAIVIPMMGNMAEQNVANAPPPALLPTTPTAKKPLPPAAVPAPVATSAPAQSTVPATPEARLMTPEELKKFNAEFEKNTKKGAEAKQQQPVKESAAQSSAATDRGMDIKAKSRPVMRAKMDESPASPVAATDLAAPEPQKKVITPKFNDVFTAVMYQDLAAVKELLDLGWWVDKPEPGGSTPLMAAVKIGDTAIAELLLQHGANPNVFARGNSALRLARRNHNAALVALLQRYGATEE